MAVRLLLLLLLLDQAQSHQGSPERGATLVISRHGFYLSAKAGSLIQRQSHHARSCLCSARLA